jgi:hypothetical protein
MTRAALSLCGAAVLLFPIALLGRIPIQEGTEDLRNLAQPAPYVFHATVVGFETTRSSMGESGIVNLTVNRWYKGKTSGTVRLKFTYSWLMAGNGHDCVDLRRSDSWLIFAKQSSPGILEFSHDCQGGLPMSALLADHPTGAWDQVLQLDLITGLQDSDQRFRLANIARLGGLKLVSSVESLRRFVDTGSELESKWATYAALRLGDLSVLPEVERIVTAIEIPGSRRGRTEIPEETPAPMADRTAYPSPDGAIALQLSELRDRQAVPALTRILQSAVDPMVRGCAATALAEIQDSASLSEMAEHLKSADTGVRYKALLFMERVTSQSECTVPSSLREADFLSAAERCKAWWEQTGKFTIVH